MPNTQVLLVVIVGSHSLSTANFTKGIFLKQPLVVVYQTLFPAKYQSSSLFGFEEDIIFKTSLTPEI
jgi:hypothetical protein